MTFGSEADEATSQAIVDRFLEAAATSSTPPTCTRRGVEEITGRAIARQARRHRARDQGAVPDGCRPERRRRVATPHPASGSKRRCAGSAPSGSTSTRCTAGTRARRSRRRSRRSTTSCARARSATSAQRLRGLAPRKALGIAPSRGWEPFVSLQPEYSLITRDIERELLPLCRGRASRCFRGAPWPAASSPASTKRRRFPAGTRGGDTENPITFTYRLDERAWNIVDAVARSPRRTGKTVAQVALNWVTNRPGDHGADHRCEQLEQLDDNLGAVGWQLEKEHRQGARVGESVPRSATRTSSSSTPTLIPGPRRGPATDLGDYAVLRRRGGRGRRCRPTGDAACSSPGPRSGGSARG